MYRTDLPVETIYRPLKRCLVLDIDTRDLSSLSDQIRRGAAIEGWAHRLIGGEINDDEFLEGVEPLLGTNQMDLYISDITRNLLTSLVWQALGED